MSQVIYIYLDNISKLFVLFCLFLFLSLVYISLLFFVDSWALNATTSGIPHRILGDTTWAWISCRWIAKALSSIELGGKIYYRMEWSEAHRAGCQEGNLNDQPNAVEINLANVVAMEWQENTYLRPRSHFHSLFLRFQVRYEITD